MTGDHESAGGKAARSARIREIVTDAMRRRHAGEGLSDERLIEEHGDLMPELADELAKARQIDQARRAASPDLTDTESETPTNAYDEGDTQNAWATELSTPTRPLTAAHIEVPGYTLERELSRGGQAVVFLAAHEATGRRVAVKVMREGPLATSQGRARFDREVQVLAALNHPHIVRIIDRGVTRDGSDFLAMDFVDGAPLNEWLDQYYHDHPDGPPPNDPAELLRMFMKICDAVNAAHVRGIVHRDLKPTNILVDERGEPHVLDFGLARLGIGDHTHNSQEAISITGQFLGSLPWASPEQAEGDPNKIDIRTDVYSLGVILYQMLTGRFPYEVVGAMRDVLDNIMSAEPMPPSTVMAARDAKDAQRRKMKRPSPLNMTVDAIVLKSLAKRRDDRYQSAGDLARDVANYLSGRPTSAVAPSARSHRPVIAAALLIVVAAAALIGWQWLASRSDAPPAHVAPTATEPDATATAPLFDYSENEEVMFEDDFKQDTGAWHPHPYPDRQPAPAIVDGVLRGTTDDNGSKAVELLGIRPIDGSRQHVTVYARYRPHDRGGKRDADLSVFLICGDLPSVGWTLFGRTNAILFRGVLPDEHGKFWRCHIEGERLQLPHRPDAASPFAWRTVRMRIIPAGEQRMRVVIDTRDADGQWRQVLHTPERIDDRKLYYINDGGPVEGVDHLPMPAKPFDGLRIGLGGEQSTIEIDAVAVTVQPQAMVDNDTAQASVDATVPSSPPFAFDDDEKVVFVDHFDEDRGRWRQLAGDGRPAIAEGMLGEDGADSSIEIETRDVPPLDLHHQHVTVYARYRPVDRGGNLSAKLGLNLRGGGTIPAVGAAIYAYHGTQTRLQTVLTDEAGRPWRCSVTGEPIIPTRQLESDGPYMWREVRLRVERIDDSTFRSVIELRDGDAWRPIVRTPDRMEPDGDDPPRRYIKTADNVEAGDRAPATDFPIPDEAFERLRISLHNTEAAIEVDAVAVTVRSAVPSP